MVFFRENNTCTSFYFQWSIPAQKSMGSLSKSRNTASATILFNYLAWGASYFLKYYSKTRFLKPNIN